MKTKLMLKNSGKSNNEGFSLVELIVVVLIIAVIAVALAPQVVKYVGQARISTDKYQLAEVKSAAQAAVAEYMSEHDLKTLYDDFTEEYTEEYYVWNDSKKTVELDGGIPTDCEEPNPGLTKMITDNIGNEKLGHDYSIVIQTDGTVTVTEM